LLSGTVDAVKNAIFLGSIKLFFLSVYQDYCARWIVELRYQVVLRYSALFDLEFHLVDYILLPCYKKSQQ
jgi:hypothetical protein